MLENTLKVKMKRWRHFYKQEDRSCSSIALKLDLRPIFTQRGDLSMIWFLAKLTWITNADLLLLQITNFIRLRSNLHIMC